MRRCGVEEEKRIDVEKIGISVDVILNFIWTFSRMGKADKYSIQKAPCVNDQK